MGVCENLVDTCKIQEKFMAQHYLTLCESPEGLFWGGFPRPPPGNLLPLGLNLRPLHLLHRLFTIEPPEKPSLCIKELVSFCKSWRVWF